MANITIYDLQESFELDKEALAKLLGGRGYGSWTKIIDCRFTGKKNTVSISSTRKMSRTDSINEMRFA